MDFLAKPFRGKKKKKHADNNLWNSLATEERLFYSPKSNGMEEGQLLLEPHHQGFGIRRLFSKVCEASGVHYRPQSDSQKQSIYCRRIFIRKSRLFLFSFNTTKHLAISIRTERFLNPAGIGLLRQQQLLLLLLLLSCCCCCCCSSATDTAGAAGAALGASPTTPSSAFSLSDALAGWLSLFAFRLPPSPPTAACGCLLQCLPHGTDRPGTIDFQGHG